MTESTYEYYKPILVELVAFAKRPGMYVGKEEMDAILAFIGGVELSSKFKLRFGSDLINFIFKQYPNLQALQAIRTNIHYYTLKQQTEILSKTTSQTPVQVFSQEAIRFLVHVSDIGLSGYYRQTLIAHLKGALVKNLDAIDEEFGNSFNSSPEDQILKFLTEWPGLSLDGEAMELLQAISNVNLSRKLLWTKHQPGDLDDKSKLRDLSKELLVRLTVQSQ